MPGRFSEREAIHVAADADALASELSFRVPALCCGVNGERISHGQPASVSATHSVPQSSHAVAEPSLVNPFQLQPHTMRKEPLPGADDRREDQRLKLVNKTSPQGVLGEPGHIDGDVGAGVARLSRHTRSGSDSRWMRVRTLRGSAQ